MLAYQLETSGLRSRSEIAICSEVNFSEDGDLLRTFLFQILRFEILEILKSQS